LELTDTGFDASVLSEFRARLLTDDQTQRLLNLWVPESRSSVLSCRFAREAT
jgi:hypothetical protein